MTGILNLQLKPKVGDKEFNLKKIDLFIKKFADRKLDLVVLPEFFSTGVHHESFLNAPEDEDGGETIKTICEYAKKYKTNIIAGSVIEQDDGKLYNTSFAINREGCVVAKYRKIHLYNYMGGTEGDRITPGDELVVADFDFGKVGMAICYDMRYPLHFKKLAQAGAEIIALPTAWLVPNEVYEDSDSCRFAAGTWEAMNKTRAFDNLVYIVSCNQCGRANAEMSGLGHSMIVAPTSEILANAKDEQGAVYADIDLELVKYYKSIYPIASID
ncbi:MAG: hypothetical protein NC191_00260 [Muribaculaceae bacterium]|nr:hypothetical protein [Muribaculaceae bacterium]